jgi:hypothetical protein
MSYNGSGLFQINTSGQPVVAGTVITASAFNALTADLATGLTTAITKDGQTATTAQIPFAQGLRSTLVTDSTTSTSGSIITDGGLGVAKAANIGTTLGVTGAITGSSTITGTKLIPTGTSATGNGMYLPATNTLGFSTNGTLAAVIDANQNVGVGVTPSAWGSGRRSLSVAGSTANYFIGANANPTVFGANTFHDGSDNKYIATGYANLYLQSSGQHLWYNAASGTAGNNITFTQAMTLDTNGKLTIARTDGTGISSIGVYNTTTASAANVFVVSDGTFQRSTSSARFKTNVETIEAQYAQNILNARPVWYRSLCADDNKDWGHWGFIAEELAMVDPRLVHWKTEETTFVTEEVEGQPVTKQVSTKLDTPIADGVQYDRFVPLLLKQLQEQQALITQLQADVAALKG